MSEKDTREAAHTLLKSKIRKVLLNICAGEDLRPAYLAPSPHQYPCAKRLFLRVQLERCLLSQPRAPADARAWLRVPLPPPRVPQLLVTCPRWQLSADQGQESRRRLALLGVQG